MIVIGLLYPREQDKWIRDTFAPSLRRHAKERHMSDPSFRYIPLDVQPRVEQVAARVSSFSRYYDLIFVCDIGTFDDHGNLLRITLNLDEVVLARLKVGVTDNDDGGADDRLTTWEGSTEIEVVSMLELARTFL